MIVHQDVGVSGDSESFGCLREQLQEMEAIRIIAVNGFTLIAPERDLVTAAGPVDAQWPCHAAHASAAGSKVTSFNCQLLRCDTRPNDPSFLRKEYFWVLTARA